MKEKIILGNKVELPYDSIGFGTGTLAISFKAGDITTLEKSFRDAGQNNLELIQQCDAEGHVQATHERYDIFREITKTIGATPEELEKVRCACEQERDLAIVEFLYSSAVRVSELCRLNRDDICWESDDVMVLGKGNKEREVYLNARAHLHLKQYLESRADDNPALFVGTRAPHKRLTKSGIRNILKKVGNAAGVSKVHPHRFRRTSATDLLRMGMPIEQVQELLGHVKIETTRIYCTVTKEQVRASHRRFMAA